ncbi:aldehyde dehydrogenase family protein [Streptomyces sp. SID8366]|uniref:aldehyde dehydrogenase (NADP(+)) n=1 Tax=unclassified Streptomyces TaxID=2593676 RepID=UPI000DBA4B42|nr:MULTISPECIES: aldehyde dehydrogenase (NADP(+)) [unclassified Streptomyces]MYU07173.1 aldehyde dehydrogenase family protein [Streptomyces sp. SID8366]MYU61642.1 aldehyde dehydrogenase family protein [Streptomyces sp. SID69]RAJ61419.1 NADP-dependent aldehyde dehydrogenase [Streptomyces sp. PsTaAH-130]
MTGTTSAPLRGISPRTGEPVGDPVAVSTAQDVDVAARAAARAFPVWSAVPAADRARALDAAADALDAARDELVAVADAETALGEARLTGEVGRTSGQLRLFAEVLRDGGHVQAVLTPADPAAGRPDIRRMRQAIGPVAVFGASNFPFAFSVAGGDTASALAAGCPVVVKAHEGHPGTSAAVARIVAGALREAGAPEGVLALVTGFEAGAALVSHPAVKAAGFTGSPSGGRALYDLAAARPEPIPFYGELGSVNPVVVLPGAAAERAGEIAEGYAQSLTLGTGQFCTNPGLLFVPEEGALIDAVAARVGATATGAMLTSRIRDGYRAGVAERDEAPDLLPLASGSAGGDSFAVAPRVWRLSLKSFADRLDSLAEECFGPAGLVVTYPDLESLTEVLVSLPGSLTGSVHATPGDAAAAARVLTALRHRVGRLIHNGWPTGVAVCWAMHHGGPWPSTTAPLHTSVGATAIDRWLVPIAYQDCPDDLLPPELQNTNPLGIPRRVG